MLIQRFKQHRSTRVIMLLLLGMIYLSRSQAVLSQSNPIVEFMLQLNEVRLNEGLPPLAESTLLSQAAQRHADDIASRGTATHEGSDGSNYRQRIRDTGYRAWNDGLLVNESFWMGLGDAEDAIGWFSTNAEYGQLLVDPRYREVGVGYAEDGKGVNYYVINLGVRPGVLPIFINDDAAETDSPQIAVRLSNEEAESLGEGSWIGKAIEVRLSSTPNFDDVPWQPWEPLLPWVLDNAAPGDYAVYVEYRDGAGRTAVAEDTIWLSTQGEGTAPTPSNENPTLEPTEPPTQEPTPEATTPEPSVESSTPLPETPADTPTPPIDENAGTPAISPTATATPEILAQATPQPTWTPLPPPVTQAEENRSSIDWPLWLAFSLQGIALLLGVAAFLRRR